MAIANVHVGSVQVTYKSTNLGWTDEAGISVSFDGHEYVNINADEFGAYLVGKVDIGIPSFKVKFNLIENSYANRALLMPNATAVGGVKMAEGKTIGTEMTSTHGALNLRPRRLVATADASLDIDVFKMLLEIKGDYVQDVRSVQNLPIEGEAIIDTSRTSAEGFLFTFGGVTP